MGSNVVCDISISVDGYVAGPNQSRDKPFGDGAVDRLHAWMFETPDENQAELDGIVAAGAFVMGRNMFGPVRGEWDLDWQGWWGDEPPSPTDSGAEARPAPGPRSAASSRSRSSSANSAGLAAAARWSPAGRRGPAGEPGGASPGWRA